MDDWLGLLICLLYVGLMLGLAELLRSRWGLSARFTRKYIHISVGMMSWALPFLFTVPWYFVLACAGFALFNWLDWRYGLIKSMQSSNEANLGTVYFPIMAAIVTLLFWSQPPLLVAALMPLTWGDGLAPVVGYHYGRHVYAFQANNRTWEGSSGFFLATLLFTWLALWVMPGTPDLTPAMAFLPAFTLALATTLVEAVSPWGIDNITITAVAILLLHFWF
jgi:phytol kinase